MLAAIAFGACCEYATASPSLPFAALPRCRLRVSPSFRSLTKRIAIADKILHSADPATLFVDGLDGDDEAGEAKPVGAPGKDEEAAVKVD